MKSMTVMFSRAWVLGVALFVGPFHEGVAQTVSSGVEVSSGKGEDQKSKVYVMKGPYVLRWDLRDIKPSRSQDALADYWKPHTAEKPPWVSVRVMDADTQSHVKGDVVSAWSGTLQVDRGGRHYLIVTGEEHVGWTIRAKEGKVAMVNDKETVVKLSASDLGGGTAKDAAEKLITNLRSELNGASLDERVAAVRLIESKSNSADDFAKRWQEYSRIQGW